MYLTNVSVENVHIMHLYGLENVMREMAAMERDRVSVDLQPLTGTLSAPQMLHE
jgi:hypothetical protein